jgi:hypothetical protein
VLAHIRKEWGLKGRDLLEETERILLLHQRQEEEEEEENVQADAASRFQLVPDWHLDPRVFQQISSLWGPPQINLFASLQSAQTKRFMSWRAGFRAGLPLSFHSSPQEGREEAGVVEGGVSPRHSILGSPDLVRQSPGASSVGRSSSSLPQRHHQPVDRGASSISGAALPSRLEDLRGSWGVDAVSDRSFRLIAAG